MTKEAKIRESLTKSYSLQTPEKIDDVPFESNWSYGIVVQDDPVNFRDPSGLTWKLGSSVNLLFFDYGWDTSNPSKANLNLDLGSVVGGGWQFTWEKDSNKKCGTSSNGQATPIPNTWNFGLNKYLGISVGENFSSFSLNIGLGIGLPISVTSPIEGDYSFGGWLYDVTHPGK